MGRDRRRRRAPAPRRTLAYILFACALVAGSAGLWVRTRPQPPSLDLASLPPARPASVPRVASDGRSGSFSVLTHDVAGGPRWLTGVDAGERAPALGARLDGYDLVLLQRDHSAHAELRAAANHPYTSTVGSVRRHLLGDGLSRFSRLSFVPVARTAWGACHGLWDAGHDCLASQGFSRAETRLADDAALDVYNLALDDGPTRADRMAREQQLAQLAEALEEHSAQRAVLVAGDTALDPSSPEDAVLLAKFLQRTGLRDTCDALLCDAPSRARIFYRGTTQLSLSPVGWQRANELAGLSGRDAVSARFRWRLEAPGQRAAVLIR